MKKMFRVFGLAKGEKEVKEFNGEIVTVEGVNTKNECFYFEGDKFTVNKKQLYPVQLLYPNVIYVAEDGLHNIEETEKAVVNEGKISNCYARQGTHWLKYYLDPESLTLADEEDEEKADELAREASDVIVSFEKLKHVLKNSGLSDKDIKKIISKL